jgi:phosphoglycerol transferase
MKHNKLSFSAYLLLVMLLSTILINGCGENTALKKKKSMDKTALAQGIDFTKPGYPAFIAEVTGMSYEEPWSRWTEGGKAVFRFTDALPAKFTLVIKAGAIGPNLNAPIKVTAGTEQQEFVIRRKDSADTCLLSFNLKEPADTISIIVPHPISPAELQMNTDTRKLGVALISLKIES